MEKILNELSSCKDAKKVENVVNLVIRELQKHLTCEEEMSLEQTIYEELKVHHFNKESADLAIKQFYYVSQEGDIIHAPFISERECIELYNDCKEEIEGSNLYDYIVVLNNTIANYHNLLYKWWRNEDWDILLQKFSEIAVNWLNDDDYIHKGEKAWYVMHR